jgi:hypothetical protein
MTAVTDDRCDACGQRAYTAWYSPQTRGLLLLCAHHTHEHELALTAQSFELSIDDRATLTPA